MITKRSPDYGLLPLQRSAPRSGIRGCLEVFITSVLVIAVAAPLSAAEIKVLTAGGNSNVIVSGPLEAGDVEKFVAAVLPLKSATVFLDSPGGRVAVGLELGKAIRLKQFTTVVPDGATCASACGIAWLGGTERLVSTAGRVGFHAAYRVLDGRTEEVGQGNALVGAFMSALGYSTSAIAYVTAAGPNSMQWLTKADADRHFLNVGFVGSIKSPADTRQRASVSAPLVTAPSRPELGPRLTPQPTQPATVAPLPPPKPRSSTYRAAVLIQAAVNDQQNIETQVGTTVWRLEESRRPNANGSPALRADVDIPAAGFRMVFLIEKNNDPTLRASHMLTFRFLPQAGARLPAIAEMGSPQMRNESAPGVEPLAGAQAKITDQIYIVALNADPDFAARNLETMKSRGWFDFPIRLADGRIAKITLEKGAEGERLLRTAFQAFEKLTSAGPPAPTTTVAPKSNREPIRSYERDADDGSLLDEVLRSVGANEAIINRILSPLTYEPVKWLLSKGDKVRIEFDPDDRNTIVRLTVSRANVARISIVLADSGEYVAIAQ